MCNHENFEAQVDVNRFVDIGRFAVDVRVNCVDCGIPFRFLGLPGGLRLEGAAVSVDGTEARLAIAPIGEEIKPIVGTTGFSHPVLIGG